MESDYRFKKTNQRFESSNSERWEAIQIVEA